MAPSVGKTSDSTRNATYTSAQQARPCGRRARWSTVVRHFFTWPACATVAAVCSRRSVARRRLSAGCCAASTRRLATLLASWPRLRHSNDRGVTENALRCCLLISSAFCGFGGCVLRGPRGAQFEFTLAAIAQNLRRLAKLVARPPPLVAPCVA